MSPVHPTDRRVLRTGAALRAAVLDLTATADYDAITVEDVLRTAEVSRGTFYAHYADKDALFVEATEALMSNLVDELRAVATVGTGTLTGAGVHRLFAHAEQHRHTYLAMLQGAAGGVPLRSYVDRLTATFRAMQDTTMASLGPTPRIPLDALARAWVGEQLALTSWWLLERPPYNAADLTRMRMRLMTDGPSWVYGLQPGQLTFDEEAFDALIAEPEPSAT